MHEQRKGKHRGNRGNMRLRWLPLTILALGGAVVTGEVMVHGLHLDPQASIRSLPSTPKGSTPVSQLVPRSAFKPAPRQVPLPSHALIHVPAMSQLPQLPNGCEITSLSMLLSAVHHPIDKMTLAREMPKDPTKEVIDNNGNIVYWGNPNVGFVGDVDDHASGYGIYHGPMARFLNHLLPHRALDLTGQPFSDILGYVANGTPVELWATATFQPTNNWQTWQSPEGPVKATMDEHAVLLVGYNRTTLFINNPLTGQAAEPVSRQPFLAAWKQLGEQALTVKPLR